MKERVPEQVCTGEDHEENATKGSALAVVQVDERQQDQHEDDVVRGGGGVVEAPVNIVGDPGWKPADVFLEDVQKVRCR
jgi:predicted ATP-dependent serine protease